MAGSVSRAVKASSSVASAEMMASQMRFWFTSWTCGFRIPVSFAARMRSSTRAWPAMP
jgi:hypothetical protein